MRFSKEPVPAASLAAGGAEGPGEPECEHAALAGVGRPAAHGLGAGGARAAGLHLHHSGPAQSNRTLQSTLYND